MQIKPPFSRPSVVLIGDNTAVDALAAALTATHPDQPFDLRAVMVTGRPVSEVAHDAGDGSVELDPRQAEASQVRETPQMHEAPEAVPDDVANPYDDLPDAGWDGGFEI